MEEASSGSKDDYDMGHSRRGTPVQLKGVAMSFGFKHRKPVAQCIEKNGKSSGAMNNNNKDRSPSDYHLDTKKDDTNKYKVNRFGFRQTPVSRYENATSHSHSPVERISNEYPNNNNNNNNNTLTKLRGLSSLRPKTSYVTTENDSNRNRILVKKNSTERATSAYAQMPRLQSMTTMNIMDTKVAKTLMNTNRRIAANKTPGERSTDNSNSYRTVFSTLSSPLYRKPIYEPSRSSSKKHSIIKDEDHEQQKNIFTDKSRNEQLFVKPKSTQQILKLTANSPEENSNLDECEWINGGEAMADEVSIYMSPERIPPKKNLVLDVKTNNNNKIKTANNKSKNNLLIEDPKFAAVAAAAACNNILLIDDEPSPIESLISTSESDELFKRKKNKSQSDSKDINEKLTPSPGTPTNISMSLSDGKDDFLIDDEIADQPELVFENTPQNYNSIENIVNIPKPQTPKFVKRSPIKLDLNSLTLKNKKGSCSRTGSLDTLSPCDSIASDDLMMDYDGSSDIDDCDRNERQERGCAVKLFLKDNNKETLSSEPCRQYPWVKSDKISFIKKINNSSPTNSLGRPVKMNEKESYSENDLVNHAAMKQEISNIKTMLFELKRVLNESETQLGLDSFSGSNSDLMFSLSESSADNSEIQLEISEMRRQIVFLQGQLEDKELNMQQFKDKMAKLNTENKIKLSSQSLDLDENTCNAATQTERVRPLSSSLTLIESPTIEDNMESLVRFQAENGNSSVQYVSSIVHTMGEETNGSRKSNSAKSLGFISNNKD